MAYIPCECKLIAFSKGQDADGYTEYTPHDTDMFCAMSSVNHREYYEALQAGIKPVCTIVVNAWEYEESFYRLNPPEKAEINGIRYKIERAYRTDLDHYELTLSYDQKDNVIEEGEYGYND